MSGSYRKKKGFISALAGDKGFYSVLTVSILMVCLAAYLALSYGGTQQHQQIEKPSEGTKTINSDDIRPNPFQEVTPTEDSKVSKPMEGITEAPTQPATEPATTEQTKVTFIIPVDMTLVGSVNVFAGTSPVFSETLNDWRLHQGMDFLTSGTQPVYASANGVVEDVYEDAMMGCSLLILHPDGSRSLYQSMSTVSVNKNEAVTAGKIVGYTGKTADAEETMGEHLHFAVIRDGAFIDPNDLFMIH